MAIDNYALIGAITLRVLVIHGPGRMRITGSKVAAIQTQVDECCGSLTRMEPRARLEFKTSFDHVTVVPNATVTDPATDSQEDGWLPHAMRSLGFDDHEAYLKHTMARDQTHQGALAIVTELPKPHFAYATNDKITIEPSCGGYGEHLMHAILMHEICHVFGAADEQPECNCDRRHGHLRAKHGNCYVCNPDPVRCIMASNSLDLCSSTRRQIGWDKRLFPKR